VHAFDPATDAGDLERIVHRWTRGPDLVALVWILRQLLEKHGSIERSVAAGLDPAAADVGPAIEAWSTQARAINLRPAYGRVPRSPGVFYFFSRPSTGRPASA
jgi:hypothetical protein